MQPSVHVQGTLYTVIPVLFSLTPVALTLGYECVHVTLKALMDLTGSSGLAATFTFIVGLNRGREGCLSMYKINACLFTKPNDAYTIYNVIIIKTA